MHFPSVTTFLAFAFATATATDEQLKGFNYGATNADGSCRDYEFFHAQFTRANSLQNAAGFTSARMYTSIQCGTDNAPIEAIKAALDTNTNLLLGLWASSGKATIENEIIALMQAAKNWPTKMKQRVVGISVGSEDLYRNSAQGQANDAGEGATSKQIVSYINQVRTALRGTTLEDKKIGHVDTWTAWMLPTSISTIDAADFLGHNGFPYFENNFPNNSISNALHRFNTALFQTDGVAGGKPVWVTETGWPWAGAKSGQAVASIANAEAYWDVVGCSLFGTRNVWWYNWLDDNPDQTDISFGQ